MSTKSKSRGRPKGVKNGQGKPKPPTKDHPGPDKHVLSENDYGLVATLSSAAAPYEEIADYLGISRKTFYNILDRDERLAGIMAMNTAKGHISVRRGQLQKAMDRYMTICKDCHKIHMGEFLPSCPYCDQTEPEDEEGNSLVGQHTNVTHKHIPGDTGMLIWLGKVWLKQSERLILGGDPGTP
jgi:hypothetical protein